MKAIEDLKSFLNIGQMEAAASTEIKCLLMEVEHSVVFRYIEVGLVCLAVGLAVGHFAF